MSYSQKKEPVFITFTVTETRDGLQYFINDNPLTEYDLKHSQSIRNHSPDGFNYGYAGSGPAQLSLAICLKIWGRIGKEFYQKFKDEFIARLDGEARNITQTWDVTWYDQIARTCFSIVPVAGLPWEVKRDNIEKLWEESQVTAVYLLDEHGQEYEYEYAIEPDETENDPENVTAIENLKKACNLYLLLE